MKDAQEARVTRSDVIRSHADADLPTSSYHHSEATEILTTSLCPKVTLPNVTLSVNIALTPLYNATLTC